MIDSLVAESSSGIEDILDNQLCCFTEYEVKSLKYLKAFERHNETKKNIYETINYYSNRNWVLDLLQIDKELLKGYFDQFNIIIERFDKAID